MGSCLSSLLICISSLMPVWSPNEYNLKYQVWKDLLSYTYSIPIYLMNSCSEKNEDNGSPDPQQALRSLQIIQLLTDLMIFLNHISMKSGKCGWYMQVSQFRSYKERIIKSWNAYPAYAVHIAEDGTPEAYTTAHLRPAERPGELWEWNRVDLFVWRGRLVYKFNSNCKTKAGITYCNTHSLTIAAMDLDGAGYVRRQLYCNSRSCLWMSLAGQSKNGPEGDKAWGLNSEDYTITSNTITLDSYLSATQQYIDYCKANGYTTKVFFTTGPVDNESCWARRVISGTYKNMKILEIMLLLILQEYYLTMQISYVIMITENQRQ